MSEYAYLHETAGTSTDIELGTPANSEIIAAAEQILGDFPEDYRRFLGEVGWCGIWDCEVFGLGPGIPSYLDVVALATSEHADYGLPTHLIPVMNNGAGDLTCIDKGRFDSVERTAPMVVWYHETSPSEGPVDVADSFSGWLKGLLADT